MRRRLEKFLPIVLMALMVQILAPIGACWAAAIAASDPLQAEICHTDLGQGSSGGQGGGQHQAHDGACAICCAAQASAALDTPQTATVVAPNRYSAAVIWHDDAPALPATDIRFHAQARAPPFLS
jgi:Protein of unknown function (DUF2946)